MADEDEFAQTRGADDLFDDEIIPVPAEEQQVSSDIPPQEVPEAATKPDDTPTESPAASASPAPAQPPAGPRRGGERGRGRGRGRGRAGRGANASGRRGEGGNKKAVEGTPEPESGNGNVEGEKKAEEKDDDAASESKGSNGGAEQRVPAVRGDRSATGGIKKPKLTEEQLTQRMAAAKENAAKLSAAHARAEADQASFLEREKVADEKRRQERANRRVMDSERERNRQRKMNALNGREWDATKQEEDYNPRGGKGGFRRGMHGGVSGYTRRDFDDSRPDENGRDNQGGYRGNQRGRGRGRGGRGRNNSCGPRRDGWQPDDAFEKPASATNETKPSTPAPAASNEAEFPALPGAKDRPADVKPNWAAAEKIEPSWSPVEGSTWADEVEAQ